MFSANNSQMYKCHKTDVSTCFASLLLVLFGHFKVIYLSFIPPSAIVTINSCAGWCHKQFKYNMLTHNILYNEMYTMSRVSCWMKNSVLFSRQRPVTASRS